MSWSVTMPCLFCSLFFSHYGNFARNISRLNPHRKRGYSGRIPASEWAVCLRKRAIPHPRETYRSNERASLPKLQIACDPHQTISDYFFRLFHKRSLARPLARGKKKGFVEMPTEPSNERERRVAARIAGAAAPPAISRATLARAPASTSARMVSLLMSMESDTMQ